jgi:hypothetical protein
VTLFQGRNCIGYNALEEIRLVEKNVPIFISYLPLILTLLVAIGGWIFAYLHTRHQEQRRSKLSLVDKKLRLFYGPLYARLLAGNAAWDAFSKTKWPSHGGQGYFTKGHDVTNAELETWRHWMKNVFHPMNKKLEAIIVENLDLIEGDIHASFIAALSHIHVYDAVLASWEVGDFSDHTSIINFPAQDLISVVEPVYLRLREEQKTLSGTKAH